ncbi:MAG TPA: penicillin-binding transpeptidase domain-containing protein [Bryobacteraceae bacterium]|nr:penicillin-binding transpeptidase domain-containing protein [Bryobacteraceae bacterium]
MSICAAAVLLSAVSLYEQSAARILAMRFTGPQISYLVVDAATGRLIGSNWPEPERPVFVGSLVKPFVARALPAHARRHCHPERCWQPAGHGDIDFVHAIAYSCNSYFLDAVAELEGDRLASVLKDFGLAPPENGTPEARIGLGRSWPVSPLALAAAYRLLLTDSGASEIRAGMRLCAARGTAHLLRADALAKTGTAPCSHAARGRGDGFVVAAWPSAQPKYLLLARVHNTSGAFAARIAGEMLRALRNGR